MNNVMIDLETMGTSHDAAIIAIGAVEFDENALGREFYVTIDLASAVQRGMKMDAGTVLWWMQQAQVARDEFKQVGTPFDAALTCFRYWMPSRNDVLIWGNGAGFDPVLLESAYLLLDEAPPWRYHNVRCYRTMKAVYDNIPFERVGTYHNALDDAKSQALHLMKISTNVRSFRGWSIKPVDQ